MANEIQKTFKLNVSKGGASRTNLTSTQTLDMTGVNMSGDTQDIGTTYEQLETGSVDTTAIYHVCIYNMDATKFIYVSFDAGTTQHGVILPEDGMVITMAASKLIHVKFDTSASQADVIACEV